MKKIMTTLLVLTLVIGSMGIFSMGAFADSSLQMRDEMVEIDEFSLHVQMWDYDGDWDAEDDIVLFEAGYGDDADSWNYAMDLVKEVAVQEDVIAIAYDRAGLGESDDTPDQKTGQNQVQHVKTMLDNIGLKGDITIVAHSIGGMNARLLADEMGPRYAGAVLVDSSHESQNEIVESYLTDPEYADMLCEMFGFYDDSNLGPIFQTDPTFIVNLYTGQFGAEGSYEDAKITCAAAAENRDAFEDKPLAVISASTMGMGDGLNAEWAAMQANHATLSDESTHITVPGSTHYVHHTEIGASIVLENILDVLDED